MAIEQTSYYRASATPTPGFAALRGNAEARVCVVGGGYAALNTALGLVERDHGAVVLLEGREIGHGASGRNGGFVFGGFSAGEQILLDRLGARVARELYEGTQQAVNLIRTRIARHGIDCQPTDKGVIWANWFRDPRVLEVRRRMMARHFGVEWELIEAARLRELVRSDRYHGALFEPNALHFHPLNYALGIARVAGERGARLHEHTPATSIERIGAGWRVRTPEGQVDCEQVVLACGGYLAGLRREVDAGILPIATYVMVTEPLGDRMDEALRTRAAIYDSRFAFDYYRPLPDSRLLWGGRISVLDRSAAAVERLLQRDLLRVFPQLRGVRIESAWSGLMSYARHEMPQVGEIEPGLWLAQAFGGHGVAPTTFAGELLASAIHEGDTRWKHLSQFGLVSAFKPAGFAGAQLRYWWLQARDAWKARREG